MLRFSKITAAAGFLLISVAQASIAEALLKLIFPETRSYSHTSNYESRKRVEAQPAAKDAEEWIERYTKRYQSWSLNVGDSYAELPDPSYWPEIITSLRAFPKNTKHDYKNRKWLKTQLLAGLLEGGRNPEGIDAAKQLILLKKDKPQNKKELSKYEYKRLDTLLSAVGLEKEERREYLAQEFTQKKETRKKKKKDFITETLNNHEIDEAIELIQAQQKKEALKEQSKFYNKLLRISQVFELKDLGDETATAYLKHLKEENKKSQHGGSFWPFSDLVRYHADNKEWDKVLEISALNTDESPDRYLRGYQLKAIYEVKGSEAFFKELNKGGKSAFLTEAHALSCLLNYRELLLTHYVVDYYRAKQENELALNLLTNVLFLEMGTDAHYRYLLEHFPEQAEGVLTELPLFNSYEERPLIWLAELQRRQGKLALAYKTVNRAIALDPSDGEQGKETRMEVYHVLSKIYKDQGNLEKSKFFNEVMLAIREGEKADDFLYLGMRKEAIRRYQEALGHFSDAYCLQSRLAKSLASEGRWDEAKVHFKRAFELMPVSFGPVESHCFGCEGIFKEEKAREIALETFNQTIKDSPQNPRTYYLLGLLLQSMDKKEEAFASFIKAFEIDPLYYNCGKVLETYLRENPKLRAEHPEILTKIMKITPPVFLQQRFRYRIDLKAAWEDADNVLKTLSYPSIPDFRLPVTIKETKENRYQSLDTEIETLKGLTREALLRRNMLLNSHY